jgi:hypothetical protein
MGHGVRSTEWRVPWQIGALIAPFYQEIRKNNFTATYRERPLGGKVIYCPSEVGLLGSIM